jgi:adenosylhomocysteine nucleosidase
VPLSKLGIIAALPAEANCLTKKKLNVCSPVEIQKDIFLCLSGMGYDSARRSSQQLIELGIDALISWGLAGSIDVSLKSGDLLLASNVITNDQSWSTHADWANKLQMECQHSSFSTLRAGIASVSDICNSISDKKNLSLKSGAIAVDMESSAIAELATTNNIDFLVVRAIADDADTNIPEAVLKHTDLLGKPNLIPFFLSCLKNPAQIKDLIKLAKCYKQALKTLKHIVPNLKKQHFLYNAAH